MGKNVKTSSSQLSITLAWWAFVIWDFIQLLGFAIVSYFEALYRVFFPPQLKSLAGERILITGAANGIGREVCLILAQSGATLICWDIDKTSNDVLLQDLTELGAKVHTFEVDISDRAQVESVSAKVKKDIGIVTMVVNNAAIMPCHTFLGHNPKELERVFQINVLGQFWILREFLPSMIKNNRGHIVTVCSAAGLIPTRHMVPYCGTKHAVHGYIEALKDELRHSPEKPDIKFTTVYPFSCNTSLTTDVKCFTRFPSLLPILEPEDVALKIVEGIQRNYEHVYIPGSIQFFGCYSKFVLPKVQAAAADFFDGHIEPTQ